MAYTHRLTAIIERIGDTYVSVCPELNISSHGTSVDEARQHLSEAVGRFFASAPRDEVEEHLLNEIFITHFDVEVGASN